MVAPRLKYFDFLDLPPHLHEVCRPIRDLAAVMLQRPDVDEDEIEVGIRKLLEARDCFVRAHLEPPGKE